MLLQAWEACHPLRHLHPEPWLHLLDHPRHPLAWAVSHLPRHPLQVLCWQEDSHPRPLPLQAA